jgi:hypothetical protein
MSPGALVSTIDLERSIVERSGKASSTGSQSAAILPETVLQLTRNSESQLARLKWLAARFQTLIVGMRFVSCSVWFSSTSSAKTISRTLTISMRQWLPICA